MLASYSFVLEEDQGIFRYIFTTRSFIKYSVYFAKANEYYTITELPDQLRQYGYTLGITKIGSLEEIAIEMDLRIKVTVYKIVFDFFVNLIPEAVLLISYDDFDGKQEKRFNCFNRWFNDFKAGNFYKEDSIIYFSEQFEFRLSIILSSENENFNLILQEFRYVSILLTQGK